MEAHSDYWEVFISLEWKSVSSFYQLVLTHDKGQGSHDPPCHVGISSKELSGQGRCVWKGGHLRALDNSH